jgi:outer membrane protein
MSGRIAVASLFVLLLVPTLARAELKVGYVDLQRALTEVEEGRSAKARLQSMLETKQKEIDKEQESLRKEKELLEKQASAMSEESRLQKQTDLQKRLFEFAQKWEKGKADMATKERSELQVIFAKMDPIIATIAQREGMTMVFEKTDSGLVFAPAHLDMTNELVRMYNEQSRVKGNPAGSKASTPSQGDAPKRDAPNKDSGKK